MGGGGHGLGVKKAYVRGAPSGLLNGMRVDYTVVLTGFGDRRVWGFSKNGGSNMGHDMHLGMPCP